MKFVKKIDPESIHHSDGIYHLPFGPALHVKVETYHSVNGVDWQLVQSNITRQQDMQTLYDSPGWKFSYLPLEIECKYCGHKCQDFELDEYNDDYDWGCNRYRICPNCKDDDCCDIHHQTLKEYNDSLEGYGEG